MVRRLTRQRSTAGDREVLYGLHPVKEALIAGRRRVFSLALDRATWSDRQAEVVNLAERRQIAWHIQSPEQLRSLTGSGRHQGVAATVSPLPVEPIEAIVKAGAASTNGCLLVLLDGILDPHNLGAIVRSAHCAGADALIIPKDRAVGATPAVSKASAGALEHTRLCRVTNLAATIQWLKEKDIWIAGLAMQAEQSVFQADLNGALALVVGGEEKGLRPLVRKHCDFLISIPLKGRIDSLNAATATAVVLYEALRQRQAKTPSSP